MSDPKKFPYPDCVGEVQGVWVRAYDGSKAEALELARLLTEAASRIGPKGT